MLSLRDLRPQIPQPKHHQSRRTQMLHHPRQTCPRPHLIQPQSPQWKVRICCPYLQQLQYNSHQARKHHCGSTTSVRDKWRWDKVDASSPVHEAADTSSLGLPDRYIFVIILVHKIQGLMASAPDYDKGIGDATGPQSTTTRTTYAKWNDSWTR
ncbi:hypothetical protein NA56DRAFT_697071 [Hyaloscypha hepaticicola]|uniref:Uncharacterized protein n=1 Tax=Hyaloscypha hepaticicola TaxID=2082293 RepID=A0A2J6QP72_9HELO|nr:hypothetical protein NA56DRAFT_697071 [Hyaloscypha hepaticicola]